MPKVFTWCLFVSLYRRVQAHISRPQSQSNPQSLPLHHNARLRLHPAARPAVPRSAGGAQERRGRPALPACADACTPLQSRAGRLPASAAGQATPGDCPGLTQLKRCWKPEGFGFPCLGRRNTPSDFIAPFIPEGAADSGPEKATGGGTAALHNAGASLTISIPGGKRCSRQTSPQRLCPDPRSQRSKPPPDTQRCQPAPCLQEKQAARHWLDLQIKHLP